jgi:poly-gamma-glutamate capsule biosynthesis protein CapA/YwtB (metallophosphatase superfamily)
MNKKWTIAAVLIAVFLAAGIYIFPPFPSAPEKTVIIEPAPIPAEQPISISISCAGDVMAHSTQYKAQYNSSTGKYDFTDNFQYVKTYIEQADLALFNLETVFAEGAPSGYPAFNAPDSLADALSVSGFDVALMSNNHLLDQGTKGLTRTLSVVRDAGMIPAGARNEGDKAYTMVNVKGVLIGIVSYTYETPMINGRKTLNGNYIPEKALELFNSFNYSDLEKDLEKISGTIEAAKANGAQIIICYFHWGEEYQRAPNQWQEKMATAAADLGADVIFASHPHVIQPVDLLTNKETGKKTAVFYSMGNFISNQREETLNNRFTEQGLLAEVSLSILKSTGEITDYKAEALPLWVDRYSDGKTHYAIIPLDQNLDQNPTLIDSGHQERARNALLDIRKLIDPAYLKTP